MSQSIAWIGLVTAGLLDVAWAVSMKYSNGYSRPGWTAVSIVLLGLFVYLLGRALQVLPVGVAYAVWTGIGAVGTVLLGVILFGDTLGPFRIGGVAFVFTGIVMLKFSPA